MELVVSKGDLQLTLKTHTNEDDFVTCMGPKNGDMIPLLKETLCGKVEMILEDTSVKKIIYRGMGESTGIEYGGDRMNIIG